MRSVLFSVASAASLLLLFCVLFSAPAAQSACTTTYNCQGNSGCISVMGSNVTSRNITEYTDQATCDSAAKRLMAGGSLPTITCSCGAGSGSSDISSNLGQLISTMTPQQQMGAAVGAVGTLMILKGLSEMMHPTPAPVDPAVQQRALAAQQLNNSGIYLMKQKNYPGAVNEFQQALAQTPNDANIANNLALAKQQQKNVVVAGKTSGALGQLLGTAPPSAGGSNSPLSNSPLNLVKMDASYDGQAQPSQESLQSQVDGALGNAPAPSSARASPAEAQEIDQIFNASPAVVVPAQPPQAQVDAEKQQVDDLFKNSTGATPDAVALAQQTSLGQAAVSAKTGEEASTTAGQGFDTAAPGVAVPSQAGAPQAVAVAATPSTASSSSVVDLSQSKQLLGQPEQSPGDAKQPMMVADLKTPPAPAPEYPITAMREPVSGFAAPGSPIFDCGGDRTLIKRLASGLPAQEDAIQRTEEAMKAAKEDSEKEREEAMDAAVSTMLASATTAADWAQTSIAAEGALRSKGIAADAAQYKLLVQMKEVLEESTNLHDLLTKPAKSYNAGYAYGNAMVVEQRAKTLQEKIDATRKFLKDSEIQDQALEEGAAKLALIAGGPVGGFTAEAVVHTLVSALDLYTHAQQAWNSAAESERAEHDLTIMDDQLRLVHGRIYELQQEVVTGCSNTKTANK